MVALAAGWMVLAGTRVEAARSDFPRPAVLEPAIGFWSRIFATYSQHQVVVHDAWYLGKVYEVLDFRPWLADGEPATADFTELRAAKIDEAKTRVRAILLRLHELGPDSEGLSPEERRIQSLFRDVPGDDKYLTAADRIRTQSGLRERFARGLAEQARYLDRMEAIFQARGLPTELVRLPMVESCFNVEAYSKVGAAGVWQFMPDTGRRYMKVNSLVDERRDPLRATEAAAEHLQGDYDSLGSWPLAITAYNHGRGGVSRGVSEIGSSDIGHLVTRYRGRAFGFASRNFYAEFLAALDVTGRARDLFGDLEVLPPFDAIEVQVERPIHLADAASRVGVSRSELIDLNPALMAPVVQGSSRIPSGYALRVPRSAAASPSQVAAALHPDADSEAPVRVASAEDRGSRSAANFGRASSAEPAPARTKKTAAARSSGGSKAAADNASKVVVHKVAPGQTLGDIARRYGTTVAMIQGMNNLRSSRTLQAGQKLRVPRDT